MERTDGPGGRYAGGWLLPFGLWIGLVALLWMPRGVSGQGQEGAVALRSLAEARRMVLGSPVDTATAVQLRGVVLFVDPQRVVYIQQEKAGLGVKWPSASSLPAVGMEVEVTALISGRGPDADPVVQAESVRILGKKDMPKPARPYLIEALNGKHDGQWIEVEGVVMQGRMEDEVLTLHMTDVAGWAVVLIHHWPEDQKLDRYWGATLRVRGLNLGRGNKAIRVPHPDYVTVLKPGQDALFGGELSTASQLRKLSGPVPDRYRVQAQVLKVDGDSIFLRGDGVSLRSSFLQPYIPGTTSPGKYELIPGPIPELVPGDFVELVGSPLKVSPYLIMSFASFRSLGSNTYPSEVVASAESVLNGSLAHDLVKISGKLVSRDQVVVNKTIAETLKLAVEDRFIQAVLESSRGGQWSGLKPGDWVEVLGMVLPTPGEPSYVIKVFQPTDVRSLGGSSTFPMQQVWRAAGVLGVLGALGAIWIVMLRRQVNFRTAQWKQANEALVRKIQEKERSDASLAQTEVMLEASELRFRTLFESSPALIVLTRFRDGRFIAANDAFLKVIGRTKEEVINKPASELNIYALPEQRLEFRKILEEKGVVRDREHLVLAKDGTVSTVLVSGELMTVDGEPHALIVGLDITDRKQAEQDTLRALARERELNELKSRFVSMVSHEFRTPLGITMSAVELLRNYFDRLSEAKRKELFEDIHRSTRLMAGLMEQVLVLGRVEAGKLSFKPARVDLAVLCQKLLDETRSATSDRCPLILEVPVALPMALADEALLRHILSNLLSNAVKYSPESRAVVLRAGREGACAVLAVQDQGIGIPAEEVSNLFQAFYRATNVGETPGTGLGLLIVRRCLELHGGTFHIDSKVGEGSTFTVRIPLFPE